jgi:hypothetical protein
MLFGKSKTPLVPDPGQRVELLMEDGSQRGGFRAVSGPLTAGTGEIVTLIATEEEWRNAGREGRRAVGIPWPVEQLEVLLPRRRKRWLARRGRFSARFKARAVGYNRWRRNRTFEQEAETDGQGSLT